MKKIKVRVDLDDVLNKFSEYFLDVHYKHTGEELDFVSWDLHKHSKFGLDIWNHLERPDFFLNAPVEHNAKKLIDYLDIHGSVFEYFIVSSYYGDDDKVFDYIYKQKKMWLLKHFSEKASRRLILVNGSKKDFPADIVIDDYWKNLVEGVDESLKLFYVRDHNKNIMIDTDYLKKVNTEGDGHNEIINILSDVVFFNDIESYLKNEFS